MPSSCSHTLPFHQQHNTRDAPVIICQGRRAEMAHSWAMESLDNHVVVCTQDIQSMCTDTAVHVMRHCDSQSSSSCCSQASWAMQASTCTITECALCIAAPSRHDSALQAGWRQACCAADAGLSQLAADWPRLSLVHVGHARHQCTDFLLGIEARSAH